jgi:CBS domain-containing protein
MKVKEIMSRPIAIIDTNNTIQEAAEKMKEKNIGDLPVVINKQAVGFITDRDITVRVVAHGLDPKSTVVSDGMSEKIHACSEDDTVEEAARIMSQNKIRRLAVADDQKNLTGLLSLQDLATKADAALAGNVLKSCGGL